ncbi:MAG: radical SAM protein, partial [Vicinamibacterales bacterium]
WYDEHGRHEIFAGNKAVPLSSTEHSLKLNAEAVAAGAQTDLDKLGIAKNAREEQLKARKAAKELTPEEKRHHAEMEKLYRQHVLKEEAMPVIQIQGLGALRHAQGGLSESKAGSKKKPTQNEPVVLHKPVV